MGALERTAVGLSVGLAVGFAVRCSVGDTLGSAVGSAVGVWVGENDGWSVVGGSVVGTSGGSAVGLVEGPSVGDSVGNDVGTSDGDGVGLGVAALHPFLKQQHLYATEPSEPAGPFVPKAWPGHDHSLVQPQSWLAHVPAYSILGINIYRRAVCCLAQPKMWSELHCLGMPVQVGRR